MIDTQAEEALVSATEEEFYNSVKKLVDEPLIDVN